MNRCHLCKSYIHDTLDSPPTRTPKGESSHRARLRKLIPALYEVVHALLISYEPELIAHIAMVDNDIELFRILTTNRDFVETLEQSLEDLSRASGLRSKVLRSWLLNKMMLVLRTIHGVHTEHSMLPIKHREREALKAAPPQPETFIEVSMSGRQAGLSLKIKIPDECDLYY